MQKTLLLSAICFSLGLAAPAFAQDSNRSDHSNQRNNSSQRDHSNQHNDSSAGDNRGNRSDGFSIGTGSVAVNNGGTSTSSFASSFNTSKAVGMSRLDGSVSDISVSSLGNAAANMGNSNGGRGGAGDEVYGGNGNGNGKGGNGKGGRSAAGANGDDGKA